VTLTTDWRLPPWDGEVHHGCATCSHTPTVAPLGLVVAVGFGSAQVTRDGAQVWFETGDEEQELYDVLHWEELAAADPEHDWRIEMNGPLRGMTYQRHGEAKWVLVDSNPGFA
jgi:hypothetical protein